VDPNDDDFDPVPDPEDGENGLVKGLRGNVDKATRQRDQAREEAKQARTELALFKSGLADLPDIQREAVLKMHTGEITPDALGQTAVALGFAQPPPPAPPTPQEVSAQTQQNIAELTAGAGTANTGVLTMDEVVSWGVDRMRAFMKEHPEDWEAMKQAGGGLKYQSRGASVISS
jgi:hypothetical protein